MAYSTGRCEWCGKHSEKLCETRDYDEGFSGPTYMVCNICRINASEAAQKELDTMYPYGLPED